MKIICRAVQSIETTIMSASNRAAFRAAADGSRIAIRTVYHWYTYGILKKKKKIYVYVHVYVLEYNVYRLAFYGGGQMIALVTCWY